MPWLLFTERAIKAWPAPQWVWKAFFLLLFYYLCCLFIFYCCAEIQSSPCSWSWSPGLTFLSVEIIDMLHHAQFTQCWGLNLGLVQARPPSLYQLGHLSSLLNDATYLIELLSTVFKYTVQGFWGHPGCYVTISTISRTFPTSQTETTILIAQYVPFP